MAIATVLCGIGMFGYGHFVQIGASAYVCALFQGIMMSGVLVGTISSVSYALDAYRESSNELFIMNMLFKNFMFYGISYVANDWVTRDGPFNVLAVCGGTSVALVRTPQIAFSPSLCTALCFYIRSKLTNSAPSPCQFGSTEKDCAVIGPVITSSKSGACSPPFKWKWVKGIKRTIASFESFSENTDRKCSFGIVNEVIIFLVIYSSSARCLLMYRMRQIV